MNGKKQVLIDFLGDNDVKDNIGTLVTGYKNYDPKKDLLKVGPEDIKQYKELYGKIFLVKRL